MFQFRNLFSPDDGSKPQPAKPEAIEPENSLEKIKTNYAEAIKAREEAYDQDVAVNKKMENKRSNLETHNKIVLGYADELVKLSDLSEEDKAAVYLAVIFHDSGKLSKGLVEHDLNHHIMGREYAEKMLDKLPPIKQGDETIEITPELKEKILQAIKRHMNHPFLVKFNKGERFPEPENEVDKIVFDADMMANVGFKNVGFRLITKSYINDDIAAASLKGIPALEETFNNVMAGVSALDKIVLSDAVKKRAGQLVEDAVKIYEYLKDSNVFKNIQEKYEDNGEYNFGTINKAPGGVQELKKDLNSAIKKAAQALGIEEKIVKNFLM